MKGDASHNEPGIAASLPPLPSRRRKGEGRAKLRAAVAALANSLRFTLQRLSASARAGQWLGVRTRATFRARAVAQGDVLLLVPAEPSLAFYYVPLCLVAIAAGAALGALT